MAANDSIKNLSGRQYQNVMRIVRQFSNGKLTKEQAALMLKNGFAFTDSDVNTFLGLDENNEDELLKKFEEFGEDLSEYEILSSKPFTNHFAEIRELNELEAKILDLINKDPLVTNQVLSEALKQDIKVIDSAIEVLTKNNILKISKDGLKREKTNVKVDKPKTLDLRIAYTYAWRSEVPENQRNSETHPSRPFCISMLKLAETKLWSRPRIEQMSAALGYDVFARVGGWWNNGKENLPHCRHEWKVVTYVKKAK
jgi:hypothetical protein